MRHTTYTVNEHYFDVIDTEEKAYWLGFIFADGSVKIGRPWHLVVTLKDQCHVKDLALALSYTGPIREVKSGGFTNNAGIHYKLFISRKHLAITLNAYKESMRIPNLGDALKRHFVRGFFDGDGSVYTYTKSYVPCGSKTGKRYYYPWIEMSIIGAESILNDIELLLNNAGIGYRLKQSKTEWLKYLVIGNKRDMPKVFSFLYEEANIYLKRKYDVWIDHFYNCPLTE